MLVDKDIIEFDAHSMVNASVIGRLERTPSLGYTTDRKRFTDFGASTRRANGKRRVGIAGQGECDTVGMSKPETMRQIMLQLKDEATQALESATHSGEQPRRWVQAFISPAEWERHHHLLDEAARQSHIAHRG